MDWLTEMMQKRDFTVSAMVRRYFSVRSRMYFCIVAYLHVLCVVCRIVYLSLSHISIYLLSARPCHVIHMPSTTTTL